jgi:hypothetical protein
MSSKIFIVSGPFGSGKTLTAVSFIPHDWHYQERPERIVIDHELRSDTYQSPDGKDHPEKLQYAFSLLGEGKLKFSDFVTLAENIHNKKSPDVIIIDDIALFQETLIDAFQDKANVLKLATLYGKNKDRCLTTTTWKPKDPGSINFFKRLMVEFMLDLKDQSIDLVITSPQHNIWENYGIPGYGADGKPLMRILGKSAKVWDCWQQMADVIWALNRIDAKTKKLKSLPSVAMDVFIPKAALPGVPEQFEWPGWNTVWEWYDTRKYVADISKLEIPEPEFTPEIIEIEEKRLKNQLVTELKGKATIEEIRDAMSQPEAPPFIITVKDAMADKTTYEASKTFILDWIDTKKKGVQNG